MKLPGKLPKLIRDGWQQLQRMRSNLAIIYKFLILAAPFLSISYYFVFVLEYLPDSVAARYGGLVVAYFVPPFGKESIPGLMLSGGIPAWVVWSTLILMDVIASFIISYNWWLVELILEHVPFLDRGYAWLQRKAEAYRKKTWLTLSLVVFMAIPFQGTGGINTSILARLLGVKAKRTVAICLVGSTLTTSIWILWWYGFLSFLKGG